MDDLAEPDVMETQPFAADNFAVALTIELERMEVPVARIQAVQGGAVLPLSAEEGRLPVRILAGSRAIATGQIVSIGDGFGILIDAVHKGA